MAARTAAVQTAGLPGRNVQPRNSRATVAGADQAAPQVVEDLPAGDEGEAVARAGRSGVGTHGNSHRRICQSPRTQRCWRRAWARTLDGVVVHHLDVGDERRARVEALEEVVREEGVLGHAPVEGGHERVHVVEPLAREDPLGEQVLVGVRDRRGVGIDAGVAGVEAREERAGGAGHGHADARLEDPVALGDAAETRRRSAGGSSGWAMMPISFFAASRGRRVSESSVRQ